MKKYWYRYFIGECPVCGKDASYKQRVYGKKTRRFHGTIYTIEL